MPMYDYMCTNKECEAVTTRYRKIVDRNDSLACSECGTGMRMAIFSAPAAKVQPEAHYICPVTKQEVTSWRERKNIFAKHDLVSAADPDQQAELRSKNLEKTRRNKKIAESYLPPDLKEKLTELGSSKDNGFHIG